MLATNKKTLSPVWTYPGLLEKHEQGRIKTEDIAVYQKCHSNVHAKMGNTSNLVSHLKHTTHLYGLASGAMNSK